MGLFSDDRPEYIKHDPLVKLADGFARAVILPIMLACLAVGVVIGLVVFAIVHFCF